MKKSTRYISAFLFVAPITLIGCGGSSSEDTADSVIPTIPLVPSTPMPPPEPPSVCSFADSDIVNGTVISDIQSLRDALHAAENNGVDDIIYINGGNYSVDYPINYDAQGSLEKISLIGCGSDAVVFNGNEASVVFDFWKNGEITDWVNGNNMDIGPFPSVHFEGLTVTGGLCSNENCNIYGKSGAGIQLENYHVTVNEIVVSNNFSISEGAGIKGAVNFEATNSLFSGNGFYGYAGGSAFSASGTVDIKNTQFINNERQAFYRGISARVNTCEHPVNIENSKFDGNDEQTVSILFYGCKEGQRNEVNVSRTEFTNNNGTVILTRGGDLTVTDSLFKNNHGGYNGDYLSGGCTQYDMDCSNGGVIMMDKWIEGHGTITITDSSFINNSTPDNGGVIAMSHGDCATNDDPRLQCADGLTGSFDAIDVMINDSEIIGNSAHRGAVVSVGRGNLAGDNYQAGNVVINDSVISNNTGISHLPINGSVPFMELETSIINVGGNLKMSNMKLENNIADTEILVHGQITEY
ncbi:hypothetical protein [Shewanella sp. MBTL60-007]|uniref:hypothetical protein n=1 Tax=Shewanella sp. MBTL60-007 TaxID=2815911 RepID=UPI001BC22E8B|nr:hypothetical protein [Shewanella sp. MBTL60-007]GIU32795.1 hypothetical protein TUM3792_45500 [Shewanella sp. MBTL60-007]